jgi:hypothetical protein
MQPLNYTTLEEGIAIFLNTIDKDLRHQDYKRTVDLMTDFSIYASGVGIDKKLKQFNLRESDQMFEQRKNLTKSTTEDIWNSCILPMQKVGKTPAAEKWVIKTEDDKPESEDNQKLQLAEASNKFYGKKSVKSYLQERMAILDGTDANGFIVVEFYPEEDGSNKYLAYPFEVSSEEAIMYEYRNAILQYLMVELPINISDGKGKQVAGNKYTIYLSENTLTATQIHKNNVAKVLSETGLPINKLKATGYNLILDEIKSSMLIQTEKDKFFLIELYTHALGYVPANQVGSISDISTRHRTYIPVIKPAQPYFEKVIKAGSEFDLSTALHTFPQKIQYNDACDGEMIGNTMVPCSKGRLTNGAICNNCKGTGMKVHTSAQDIIQLRLPKHKDEMIDLENLLVYKYPPIDLLKFQEDIALHKYRYMANKAVYNSEVFSQESTNTATEKLVDLDNVYDALQPYAENYSEMYRFIMETIAKLRNIKATIYHKFPKDFKMISFNQLLEQYKLANENNAPAYIKKALTWDISEKLYIDQPHQLQKIKVKDQFFPFPGKTEQEIALIITGDMTTKELKTLYTHFDYIFNELEAQEAKAGKNFYDYDYYKMKAMIDTKVTELIVQIEGQGSSDNISIEGSDNNQIED